MPHLALCNARCLWDRPQSFNMPQCRILFLQECNIWSWTCRDNSNFGQKVISVESIHLLRMFKMDLQIVGTSWFFFTHAYFISKVGIYFLVTLALMMKILFPLRVHPLLSTWLKSLCQMWFWVTEWNSKKSFNGFYFLFQTWHLPVSNIQVQI